jgi:predicted AlkP superfamily pyrophosphatase or phosphodiesterase
MFWWFNMYSSVDVSVTPRPIYRADGAKYPDIYTAPADLRTTLQSELGPFPLFDFWGPRASIKSTRWIADATKLVDKQFNPTLMLVYLPHLDYNLQRVGPSHPAAQDDARQVDDVCGDLIDYFDGRGARVIVLSEYGLTDVSQPVHLNRVLREHGYIAVRTEMGGELLDAGASAAFAVADHQVAHVYVNDRSRLVDVRTLLARTPGVGEVLGDGERGRYHIDHPRSGDLVLIAQPGAWFTYYYWLDDRRAPDFARTVDIHRKPGYDPVELFLDPSIALPAVRVGWKVARKALGFRMLMDVIPLDASLVKGSHGRPAGSGDDVPVFMTRETALVGTDEMASVDVYGAILRHLTA